MPNSSGGGQTPYDYIIKTARITAERAPGAEMNIGEAIMSLTLYEHIDLPYMTGDLIVADMIDLYSIGDFQGTERLELEIAFPLDSEIKNMKKTFIIDRVEGSQKANETNEVLIFHLVEDILFKSKSNVISRGYEGRPHEIIRNILRDNDLDRTINPKTTEFQESFRYLIPYLSPLDACIRIRDHATTKDGYPFFLYSSMYSDEELQYRSLAEMYQDPPIVKSERMFVHSLYATGLQDGQINQILYAEEQSAGPEASEILRKNRGVRREAMTLEDKGRVIEGYRISEQQDLLSLMRNGRIGSDLLLGDVNASGGYLKHHVDILDILEKMSDDLFPKDQKINSFDDKVLGGVHKKNGRQKTQMFTSHIYSEGRASIYDIGSTPGNNARHLATALSIKAMFKKEAIDIVVPGYNFWPKYSDKHRTIGRRIPIAFFRNGENPMEFDPEEVIDQKRSGDYIIFAAAHHFGITKYTLTLTTIKLSSRGTPATVLPEANL